jgi:hypothetical protein
VLFSGLSVLRMPVLRLELGPLMLRLAPLRPVPPMLE